MAGMLGDIAHVLTSLPVQLLVAFAVLAAVTVATGGFAFWLSRPGNIVLAVVVTFIVTHDLTHRLDGAEALGAETASQAATIRELRRDAFATQSVATAAAAREQAAAANARDLQQKVDAYEKDVATRAKSSACLLDDDDARRLRGIGGSPATKIVLPAAPAAFGRPVGVPDPKRGTDVRLFAATNRKALLEANQRLRNDSAFYQDVQRSFGSKP